jgi:hypothetical protein
MFKKVALASIFAVVSVVSFGSSTVSAARSAKIEQSVKAPVAKGMCAWGIRC